MVNLKEQASDGMPRLAPKPTSWHQVVCWQLAHSLSSRWASEGLYALADL